MNVDNWFPTSILCSNIKTDHAVLTKEAYDIQNKYPIENNWLCKTYSSINSYDLRENIVFQPLIKDLLEISVEFAKYHNLDNKKLVCTGAWINISKPGDYQEFHIHSKSHFSLVFYIKTQDKCGDIVFKNAMADFDMFPLPINEYCPSTYAICRYPAKDGRVLCFRSFLPHMVEVNKSNEDRISLALNIVVE